MSQHLDPYSTSNIWVLDGFEPAIADWRETEHPPPDVFDQVDRWWPTLEYADARSGATLVERVNSDDSEPDETDTWGLWVPKVYLHNDSEGVFRVQCFFHLHELGEHRVRCEAFHTARRLSASETDRADGMG